MDQKTKEFLTTKVIQSPDYLVIKFFPALEKLEERMHLELHHANQREGIEGIKYAQGRYDGVQEVLNLITGLQIMEDQKTPFLARLSQVFSGSGRK